MNIHWPTGKWVVIDWSMMSSEGGGQADLSLSVKLDKKDLQPHKFSVKDARYVRRRKEDTNTTAAPLPEPGPPEKFYKKPLLDFMGFNYDELFRTTTIVPGMGGTEHRNMGEHHSNVLFLDLGALQKAEKINGKVELKIIPEMNFTSNQLGGGSTPIEWVVPVYVRRWVSQENGIWYDVYDHTDYNYLVFATYDAAYNFINDRYTTIGQAGYYFPGYPGVGAAVDSPYSAAQVSDAIGFGIFQRGGSSALEMYGDIYTISIKARTYKTLAEYSVNKEDYGEGFADYQEVLSHGKLVDIYEYKVSLYLEPYDNVIRQLIRNNTFMSSIDMQLPADITIKIDDDLMMSGPEMPNDDPDTEQEGEGPR